MIYNYLKPRLPEIPSFLLVLPACSQGCLHIYVVHSKRYRSLLIQDTVTLIIINRGKGTLRWWWIFIPAERCSRSTSELRTVSSFEDSLVQLCTFLRKSWWTSEIEAVGGLLSLPTRYDWAGCNRCPGQCCSWNINERS